MAGPKPSTKIVSALVVLTILAQTGASDYHSTSSGSCVAPAVGPFAVIAVLAGNSTAAGIVYINQTAAGQPSLITGQVTGLAPNTLHGFHVHWSGDLSSGCASAGDHYNPFNVTHGDINSAEHHVGDLGNIMSDGNGTAKLNITNADIQLTGPTSVLGRTILVHALTDDLGLGGNATSLANGNSGARLTCGILGQRLK